MDAHQLVITNLTKHHAHIRLKMAAVTICEQIISAYCEVRLDNILNPFANFSCGCLVVQDAKTINLLPLNSQYSNGWFRLINRQVGALSCLELTQTSYSKLNRVLLENSTSIVAQFFVKSNDSLASFQQVVSANTRNEVNLAQSIKLDVTVNGLTQSIDNLPQSSAHLVLKKSLTEEGVLGGFVIEQSAEFKFSDYKSQ